SSRRRHTSFSRDWSSDVCSSELRFSRAKDEKQEEVKKMALTQASKQQLIEKFRINENDTGSPEVQIAILTERINQLTEHLKVHRSEERRVGKEHRQGQR